MSRNLIPVLLKVITLCLKWSIDVKRGVIVSWENSCASEKCALEIMTCEVIPMRSGQSFESQLQGVQIISALLYIGG